jgi:hypothetical protein
VKKLFSGILKALIIFVGIALVFYKCSKDSNCSPCQITNSEKDFMCMKQGDVEIFKNDSTGTLDTLKISQIEETRGNCSSPCNNSISGYWIQFSHTYWWNMDIEIYHLIPPKIRLFGAFSSLQEFILQGPTQIIVVNGITYNDVYSIEADSGQQATPCFKIDYSKSKGFVRFYFKDGTTSSRQ